MGKNCSTCGLEMMEKIVDSIFQKKEFYWEMYDLTRKLKINFGQEPPRRVLSALPHLVQV